MEVSHPVPRHHPTSATHPPFSETKGINNGSFTSVLLHASSSSVLSDSGEFPTHCSHGPGALGTQRASFEQSLRQGTSEFSRSRPAHSRGSCRKCVECTRLTEHRIVDQAKTLWPGQLASPITYLTVSRRRLEHQISSVPRTSRIWQHRAPSASSHLLPQYCRERSTIAVRRGLQAALDDLLIPITRTNVPYRASNVTLAGVKTLSVSRIPSSLERKDSKRRRMSWRWQHDADEADEADEAEEAEEAHAAWDSGSRTTRMARMARTANEPMQPSPFVSVSNALSGPVSNSVPSRMPASASMSSAVRSQSIPVLESRVASTTLNTQDSPSTIPMLLSRQSSGMMSVDDPTMQEYVQHQYAIKKEQAFACHHAMDIAQVTNKVHEEKSSSKKFLGFLSSLIPTTQT